MQKMNDGKSKEARSGDTMGDCSECDLLSISYPSPAYGHCAPKAVSIEKLWKLRLRARLPPAAMAVGCDVWKLILAIERDR